MFLSGFTSLIGHSTLTGPNGRNDCCNPAVELREKYIDTTISFTLPTMSVLLIAKKQYSTPYVIKRSFNRPIIKQQMSEHQMMEKLMLNLPSVISQGTPPRKILLE